MENNIEKINQFSILKDEPQWAREERFNALFAYPKKELPNIERVKFNRWPLFDETILTSDESDEKGYGVLTNLNEEKPLLIQYGQQTVLEQLPIELINQGVVLTDLFTAFHDYPELVKSYLGQAVKYDEDKLTAFNRAYFNSGVFLYVPKNVEITQPIEVTLIQDSSIHELFAKRVLIVLESYSSLSYIEKLLTFGEKENSANIIVEVILKEGAKLKYAALDRLGEHTTAYINRRGFLGKDAVLDWAIGVLNDGNIIGDFDTDLKGIGSQSEIKVVAISTHKQIQGIDTRVTNFARHSVGHILQHGIIMDNSTLTFNGIGHIIKGAKGSDAQQESRVLMLSDKARGDANPILLIDESDVTAGHAASVGQIDEEQLFYLTSRGISREVAEKLVIRGFLGSVITEIPSPVVQKEIINVIDEKLK